MAKVDFKKIMIDKGEKYALIGAGALMLLFAIRGILEVSDGIDPDKYAKVIVDQATGVTTKINGPVDPKSIPELPEWITGKVQRPPKVHVSWANSLFFDPIAPPDKRRINPIVLPVVEVQADFMHAKIIAYDVPDSADGLPQVGVLVQSGKKDEKLDKEQGTAILRDLQSRSLLMNRRGRPTQLVPKGGMPNPNAPVPPKNPNLKGPGATPIEEGQRQSVEYVPLDDPEKLVGKRFAWTIYPQRMVIIQASFPYKAQIEEIQKALRLENPMDVFDVYKPEDVPLFRGVLVQRQIKYVDGSVETPWSDFDLVSQYLSTIYPRKYGDKHEDPTTNYVLLDKVHKLTLPLPMMLPGSKYPDIHLPSILDTIKKQLALNKKPERPKSPSQLTGGGDPFDPVKPNAAGATGQPNTGNEGIVIPKTVTNDKSDVPSGDAKFQELPEHILIRMIDNDIQPGRLYEYRMKVLMQNPNWVGIRDKKGVAPHQNKIDLVARPSDAEVMLLGADAGNEEVIKQRFKLDGEELRKNLGGDTAWTDMKGQTVSVPREEFLFAVDPPLDEKTRKPQITFRRDGGQGVLQIQRWLPVASIDRFKEPVADWVIADIIATRGTYLGGKSIVNLPIWSSQINRYILRDAPAEKGKARRGVFMDPTRPGPQYIVVDVEGGQRENRPMTRTINVVEETAAEVLLMDENGVLQVRSSAVDRADVPRGEREAAWKSWIDRTERDTDSLLPDKKDKPKTDFN